MKTPEDKEFTTVAKIPRDGTAHCFAAAVHQAQQAHFLSVLERLYACN